MGSYMGHGTDIKVSFDCILGFWESTCGRGTD